jgi:hypothetical protein
VAPFAPAEPGSSKRAGRGIFGRKSIGPCSCRCGKSASNWLSGECRGQKISG